MSAYILIRKQICTLIFDKEHSYKNKHTTYTDLIKCQNGNIFLDKRFSLIQVALRLKVFPLAWYNLFEQPCISKQVINRHLYQKFAYQYIF